MLEARLGKAMIEECRSLQRSADQVSWSLGPFDLVFGESRRTLSELGAESRFNLIKIDPESLRSFMVPRTSRGRGTPSFAGGVKERSLFGLQVRQNNSRTVANRADESMLLHSG